MAAASAAPGGLERLGVLRCCRGTPPFSVHLPDQDSGLEETSWRPEPTADSTDLSPVAVRLLRQEAADSVCDPNGKELWCYHTVLDGWYG